MAEVVREVKELEFEHWLMLFWALWRDIKADPVDVCYWKTKALEAVVAQIVSYGRPGYTERMRQMFADAAQKVVEANIKEHAADEVVKNE